MKKKIKVRINPNIVLAVMLFFGLTFSVIQIVQSAALNPGHAWNTLDDAALPIANGGTAQTTANAAFNALAPSQTGNSGEFLTTNATDTSWANPATATSATTTRIVLHGRGSASYTNDRYCNPYGAACLTSSNASLGTIVPFAGTAKGLYGQLSVAQNAGDTCTFYLRKASGGCTGTFNNTALTCSVVDTAQACSDTTHSVSIAAGDCLQIYYDEAGGSCSALVSWSFEMQY